MYIPKCFQKNITKQELIEKLKNMYNKNNKEAQNLQLQQTGVMQSYFKVLLLEDYNVIYYESKAQSKIRCVLMGIIWKYIPDFTFKNRGYIIVDA